MDGVYPSSGCFTITFSSSVVHIARFLTLSSIYTHFNTLKKKALGNIVEKGEIAQNEQFHLLPQCFPCNLYVKILQ